MTSSCKGPISRYCEINHVSEFGCTHLGRAKRYHVMHTGRMRKIDGAGEQLQRPYVLDKDR